jgi:acyl carrier protein
MMIYARDSIQNARASGLESMQRAHWREVAVDREAIPLAVDWARYEELERLGLFYALCMRDALGGELVGYNAFFVTPHLHYMTTKFAVNDVVYVRPEHRGIEGIRLLLRAEETLVNLGVRKIIYHSKDDVVFGAGARGEGKPDSLDRVADILDLEDEFQIRLPDDVAADGLTFGALLEHLGYRKMESVYGKLVGGPA